MSSQRAVSDKFPPIDYRARQFGAREQLLARKLQALVVPVSKDLQFLTGLDIKKSERPILFILRAYGDPILVSPRFEKERLTAQTDEFQIQTYDEGEDAFALTSSILGSAKVVAISERAWFSEARSLAAAISPAQIVSAAPILTPLRWLKGEAELARIRGAVKLWQSTLSEVLGNVERGISNAALKTAITTALKVGGGSTPSCTVSIGPASALPHGSEGQTRLQEGDALLIDGGIAFDGYRSDITRTFFFGSISPSARETANVVLAAQRAAISAVRPRVTAETVDIAARKIITEAGFGAAFTHRVGHGLGLDGHEPPYLVSGNQQLLEPGMVITIEPGIYLSGKFGVRIEDDLVVTKDGVLPLSTLVSTVDTLVLEA